MKKYIFLLAAVILTAAFECAAQGFVRYEDKFPKKVREVRLSGFLNYPPFGFTDRPNELNRGRFHTVFEPMLKQIGEENNFHLVYDFHKLDYSDLVQKVRSGDTDILLGAYFDTELYKGLELVYPAIIDNPITVIMLPNRIHEAENTADLKKLKGVRIASEYYSDFVNEQMKEYQLETVNTPYELFERLFTKKADYIMISQYSGLLLAAEFNLRGQIAVAKQSLWKIPMFIGVSKLSRNRKLIVQKLTHFAAKPENREVIENNLKKMIADKEAEKQGVVPPTFGREKE